MLVGIREDKLQVAFLVRPSTAMLRGLHFEELARDALCLALPPGHALARLRSVTLAQAAREPLVVFTRKDYPEYLEYLEAQFARIKAKPRIAEDHDSAASLIAAIESGKGVALVPQSFSCSAGPRLKLISLSPAPEPLAIGAVWARDRLTPTVESFWKAAKQAVTTGLGREGIGGTHISTGTGK